MPNPFSLKRKHVMGCHSVTTWRRKLKFGMDVGLYPFDRQAHFTLNPPVCTRTHCHFHPLKLQVVIRYRTASVYWDTVTFLGAQNPYPQTPRTAKIFMWISTFMEKHLDFQEHLQVFPWKRSLEIAAFPRTTCKRQVFLGKYQDTCNTH